MLPRLLVSLVLSGFVVITQSFPFGAGPSACKTLVPGHVNQSSAPEGTCPYLIEPESEYFTPNKVFKVRLRTSMEKFKHRKIGGFFLQARAPGGDEPLGRWDVELGESAKFGLKALTCNHEYDSITHNHSKPKTADLILKFLPIGEMPEEIQFIGTIARDYVMYWTNVRSPIIRKRHADPYAEPVEIYPETTPSAPEPIPQAITPQPSAPSPRRIHHVTQTLHHNPHSTTQASHPVKHVRPSHHPHKKTTTGLPLVQTTMLATTESNVKQRIQLPNPTKTEADTEMERLLQEKKQLEEKDVAHKNLIVPGKALHADNEDIQNDGSTNPEAQQAKSKLNPARKNSADRSPASNILPTTSLITTQLLFFVCYCALNLL